MLVMACEVGLYGSFSGSDDVAGIARYAFLAGRVEPSGGRIGLGVLQGLVRAGAVGVGGVLEVDEGGGAALLAERGRGGPGVYGRRFHPVRVWPRRQAAARPRLSAPCSSFVLVVGRSALLRALDALRAAASTACAPRLTFTSHLRDRAGPRPGRGARPRASAPRPPSTPFTQTRLALRPVPGGFGAERRGRGRRGAPRPAESAGGDRLVSSPSAAAACPPFKVGRAGSCNRHHVFLPPSAVRGHLRSPR